MTWRRLQAQTRRWLSDKVVHHTTSVAGATLELDVCQFKAKFGVVCKKNGWESKWWMVHPACSATIRVPFSKALNLQQFSVQCPGNTGKSNMHRWSFPDLLHSHCYLSDFGIRFKTWRQIMQIIQFYRVFERKNVPYYNNADKSTNKQQNQ